MADRNAEHLSADRHRQYFGSSNCRDLDLNTCPRDHPPPRIIFGVTIGDSFCCRVAAMPIRSFVEPGAFEPEAIAAMSEALEAALSKLKDAGQPDVVGEVIAGRIIAAASLGERNPARLLAAALARPRGERD